LNRLKRYVYKYMSLIKKILYKGRLLNSALVMIDFLFRKTNPKGFPIILQIEPTNRCNLKCALCLTGKGKLERDIGDMDFSVFKNIIDKFEDKVIYLGLFFQGEPILNKDVFKMIEYLNSKKIYTRISTNADFDNETLKKLVHSGLDELIVSLDCADPQTYFKYKGKDNFRKIVDNVEYLIKERAAASRPFINLQLLVMKDTQDQIPAFRKLAHRLNVDRGLIKAVRINFPGGRFDYAYLPDNKRYMRNLYRTGQKRQGCYRPWVSSAILWDGSVVPCCFDMEGQYVFGNVLSDDFGQIWRSHNYALFRQSAVGCADENFICNECSVSGLRRDLSIFL